MAAGDRERGGTTRELRGLTAALTLWLGLLAAASPASATEGPPPGRPAGPWLLAPYFEASYRSDDNVFRREPGSEELQSEGIRDIAAGLTASLPVRQSLLRLRYEARGRDYEELSFERDVSQQAELDLLLRFASGDTLTFHESYTRGISDVSRVDEGGELVFQGDPFNLHRSEVDWSRRVSGRRGWQVRVARLDLNFETDRVVPFFDYRGFDGGVEIRQPLGPRHWVTVTHGSRRFRHFDPNRMGDGSPRPFRTERSQSYQLGFDGELMERGPYSVRLGWGRFRYTGSTDSEFRGLVGRAGWRVPLGERTSLEIGASRQPWPSNLDTYYLVQELRAGVDRRWLRHSHLGLRVLLARNDYGEISESTICATQRREDRRRQAEAYLDWLVHPRFGFRLSAASLRRDSNCPGLEYRAHVLSGGFRLGWF